VGFSYDTTLATDVDRLRFNVGDTVSGAGPKPDDGNFTDEELAGILESEGSIERATAYVCDALSIMWSRHVSFTADGTQIALSDVSRRFAEQASLWRTKAGRRAGSRSVTRQDGYSSGLDNVTAVSSDAD